MRKTLIRNLGAFLTCPASNKRNELPALHYKQNKFVVIVVNILFWFTTYFKYFVPQYWEIQNDKIVEIFHLLLELLKLTFIAIIISFCYLIRWKINKRLKHSLQLNGLIGKHRILLILLFFLPFKIEFPDKN